MSNQQSIHSSKRKLTSPRSKLQTPLLINTLNIEDPTEPMFAYTSRNPSQKENSMSFMLTKANSLTPNEFIKPLSANPLRTSLQQIKLVNTLKVHPTSARNSDSNNTSNLLARSSDFTKKSPEVIYKDHLFQTFQAMKFVRTLPQPEISEINNKKIWLVKRKGYENKRTIIIDLDETLIHCVEKPEMGDFSINIQLSPTQIIRVGVNIRPFAREVLASANKDFEVILFTASQKCYADEVMDYLDPTGELIHHRLYRENCLLKSGVYIKDLRIFANRNIEDIVIVDNSAYCFGYQLENGIPIISWFDDVNDRELYKLIDYIKILAQVPDIKLVNRHTFHLNTFYTDYIKDYLKFRDREI